MKIKIAKAKTAKVQAKGIIEDLTEDKIVIRDDKGEKEEYFLPDNFDSLKKGQQIIATVAVPMSNDDGKIIDYNIVGGQK